MTGACPHAGVPELGAYADGELDAAARRWWDEHLRTCVRCRDEVGRVRTLGAALRASLPTSEPSSALRDAVRQIIRAPGAFGEAPVRARARAAVLPWGAGIAALLLLGAGFGLGRVATGGGGEDVAAEVVEAHVRSLQVDHLVDIASSEHHVVKPWFAGKLDFSPPVLELAPDSFPLVGGRTEYLDQRPVAAMVYARGPHHINLFVWPAAGDGACRQEPPAVRQGFNLVHGRAGAMEFWAVSDLNAAELQAFGAAWLREVGKSEGVCRGS